MLNQLDMYIRAADLSPLYSDLAVKLHGFVMSEIDSAYAEKLHHSALNPFALFAFASGSSFIVRLSTLTDEAAQMIDALAHTREIVVYGLERPLVVERIHKAQPLAADAIPAVLDGNDFTLRFITPAAYKRDGRFAHWPELARLFKFVLSRYNHFEDACLDENQLEQLFSLVKINDFKLASARYRIGGHPIPALLGEMEVTLKARGEKLRLLRLLLGYATYAGVGSKTALGMGGFLITPRRK